MPINNRQKGLIHLYAGACGLGEFEYRSLLHRYSGCGSCADEDMDQQHFDMIMPAIEAILADRIDRGDIDRSTLPRQIKSLTYWRRRAEIPGQINRRQQHKIDELWLALQDFIGPRSDDYLLAMARKACPGCTATTTCHLTAKAAYLLVEALKDRVAWAIRKRERAAS